MKRLLNVRCFSFCVGISLFALFVVLANQALHLRTRYSFKDFFPASNRLLANEEKIKQEFELFETPAFYVTLTLNDSERGHWLMPDRVDQLDHITQTLGMMSGVRQVKSLTNLQMALDLGKDLDIGPLFKNLPASKWVSYVRSQPLLNSQLISTDLRSVLLYIEPKEMSVGDFAGLESLLQRACQGSQWTVSIGGVPAVQAHVTDRIGHEVIQFLLLSLALFCLMFLFFYRNVSPILFAAVGLTFVNITSLGWLGMFHVPMTILLSTLPVIVSTTFVSIVIHTLHLWSNRVGPGEQACDVWGYLRQSWSVLRELALPNLLGSVTTALGFIVLATADSPAIRTYATVISIVVLWTWLVTQILLVGFMHVLRPVPRQWNHRRAWWMLDLSRWSISIISITVGVCVVFAALIPKMNFSGRLFDDLPQNESVRASTENLDQRFGGMVGFDMALRSNDTDAWKDPERLIRLRSALGRIRKLPGVGSAVSVVDFFENKIPKTEKSAAELYFLFSMDQQNPLRQFLSNDFKEVRVAMRLRDLPSAQIESIRAQIRPILASVDPNAAMRETGMALNSHTLNQEMAKELVFGCWQSMLIIGLFLIVIFRSVRWALIACLPNLVPPALLIGTLSFFQTPIKPAIALIFSIALALAFNNTVYLLARLKRVQAKMKMMTVPVKRALLEEGNPCFAESFIMLVGFLIYLTSKFKLNQTFGAYMTLSIFGGALGDLVFLPALLRRFSSFLSLQPVQVLAKPVRKMSVTVRGALAGAMILGLLVGCEQVRAAIDADAVLKKAGIRLDSKSDDAEVGLKIIEANGESRDRQFHMQTLQTKNGYKALVKILAPADIRDTALLASAEGVNMQEWLYLPSTKKVRRLAASENDGGILGSELTAQDLNPTLLRKVSAKIEKQDDHSVTLELTPEVKGAYDKILIQFSVPEYLPTHTDYMLGGKVSKTVDFLNYVAVQDGLMRAQTIKIRNQQNNRGTDLQFSKLKVNNGLGEDNFTEAALTIDE